MPPQRPCPLCGHDKHMPRARLLYGTPVCRKCYYAFANRRQLAFVLDWLLWMALRYPIGVGIQSSLVALEATPSVHRAVNVTTSLLLLPLVFSLKDGFQGHSPGKFLCGVRVVDPKSFEPTGPGRSLLRNLILAVPVMPLVVAFLLQKGYRLGDGWARTKVIWKRYAMHPVFTGRYACEKCQYDLTGNTTGVCPECGAVVPPPPIGAATT